MGRPPRGNTTRTTITLLAEELATIDAAARRAGETRSGYLRASALLRARRERVVHIIRRRHHAAR